MCRISHSCLKKYKTKVFGICFGNIYKQADRLQPQYWVKNTGNCVRVHV